MAVLGVLFVTTEYRRGHDPHHVRRDPRPGPGARRQGGGAAARSRSSLGLVAATAALLVGTAIRGGNATIRSGVGTEVRLVVGTAALLAVAAVLALAIGTILRRSAGAVAAVVVLITLPYILSAAAVLPAVPRDWLLRITPAAAFAMQQTVPE